MPNTTDIGDHRGGVAERGLEGGSRAGARLLVLACGVALLAAGCSSESGGTEPILTVRSDTVEVNGSAEAPATTPDVAPGDRVQVIDDSGRGTLRLPGMVDFELFKKTNVIVPDPAEEPRDVLPVDLKGGHLLVIGNLDSSAQIELLLTGDRRLTTIRDGTSYVVCQADDGSTCLYVIDGEVEWSDPSGVARYATGEGTFAEADEGPQAARCDVDKTVDPWLAAARAGEAPGTLADQVAKLLEGSCATPPTTTTVETTTKTVEGIPTTGAELPSAVGMIQVSIADPVIGTENYTADPENYREPAALDGPIVFYVDERAVSNRDFRTWVVLLAQNDPEEWKRLVPSSWLEGVEGVETQANYPTGEDGLAVVGVRWGTADDFCRGLGKHLVTEIEWELAAVNDYLRDLEAGRQDWVAEPGEYGDEPPDEKRMLRGNDNTLRSDLHYRLSVVDTAESDATRRGARVRCAANEVQDAPLSGGGFATEEFTDDFSSLAGGWPEDEDELFSLAYHPTVYHLAPGQQHTRGAVIRNTSQPLEDVHIQAKIFIVRNRMGTVEGNHRFGVTAGSPETGFLLFTVQPDEVTGDRHDWCLSVMSDRLATMLVDANRGWYQAPLRPESHAGEFCPDGLSSGSVAVADIDAPVDLAIELSADDVVVSLNGREVESVEISVPVEAYGFFAQTYNKDKTHIHFDEVRVTVP